MFIKKSNERPRINKEKKYYFPGWKDTILKACQLFTN